MLIDRYVFRQLLWPTVFAIAALTAVAILSQSLSALNILVTQRHPLIFVQLTMLATPLVVTMILPVALLVAALITLNRLHSDQELIVCFAGGVSRWRLVAPALELAGLVTLLALAINLWVQPAAYRTMRQMLAGIEADLAANIVRPGEFAHPAAGLTVYAQHVDDDGEIHNLFIYQRFGSSGGSAALTARDGRIALRNGSPVLILRQGSNQQFNRQGVLNFLSFDEYVFDLTPFIPPSGPVRYRLSDLYLHELFFPDLRGQWERQNRLQMLAEAHSRLAAPLYNLTFMSMALLAVMGASFSRFGYGGRIAATAVLATVVRIVGFAVQSTAADADWINLLQYVVPLGAMAVALAGLFRVRLAAPRGRNVSSSRAAAGLPTTS